MKLKRESKEIDLYVDNTRLTKKEKQELVEFFEKIKLKQKLEIRKRQKAA